MIHTHRTMTNLLAYASVGCHVVRDLWRDRSIAIRKLTPSTLSTIQRESSMNAQTKRFSVSSDRSSAACAHRKLRALTRRGLFDGNCTTILFPRVFRATFKWTHLNLTHLNYYRNKRKDTNYLIVEKYFYRRKFRRTQRLLLWIKEWNNKLYRNINCWKKTKVSNIQQFKEISIINLFTS